MFITKIPSQLAHTLASARLSINSMIDALRPQMVLIPVSQRCGAVCGHPISVNAGIDAHVVAPRTYADPATKAWRELNFGKTTGKTGHSQPSRFAP